MQQQTNTEEIVELTELVNNIKIIEKEEDNTDISGLEDIKDIYEKSPIKKWIKLINNNKTINFEEYNNKEYFVPIADIVLDNELYINGKKEGLKKRNTLIQFIPKISTTIFNKKTEWLYIFVINHKIVKIGGTRTGLKGRIGSYLCGHHIRERGKSGDCSKTNGFIYNTFNFYLQLDCKIEMYGYALPKAKIIIKALGIEKKVISQTYHIYESIFLEDYKKIYNEYPLLSDNCDPEYKKLKK